MTRKTLPLHYILEQDDSVADYRPSVNHDGDLVVFERINRKGLATTALYVVPVSGESAPWRLIAAEEDHRAQTRPDWSWEGPDYRVIFNAAADSNSITVCTVDGDGRNLTETGQDLLVYPQWLAGGTQFVALNWRSGPGAPYPPISSRADLHGEVLDWNINGTVVRSIDGESVESWLYAGMPAVRPGHTAQTPLIAFAGQPVGRWTGNGYKQGLNYIFLNDVSPDGVFRSRPLEADAPLDGFDRAWQGRAPAWSPDGRWVAFESNRHGSYAIYLTEVCSGTTWPVTDDAVRAEHAKFFPCGTKLILSVAPPSSGDTGVAPWRLAWVDISSLVGG